MKGFTVTDLALHQALFTGQIMPAFQPVVHMPDGILIGLEVLARWYLPDGHSVSPEVFIPFATLNGLEPTITQALMAQSAPVVCSLAATLCHPLTVGFNAGPACLTTPDFLTACEMFTNICRNKNVCLAVEITERDPLMPTLCSSLKRLHDTGVKTVLDDYGSGFATAENLDWISPDIVKLDRSLTALAGINDPDGRLDDALRTINTYKGVKIVAEGVESIQEYDWLYGRGIRLFQGYLFSQPVSLNTLTPSSIPAFYC